MRSGNPSEKEIVVASVSGGKDSTAMCLHLKERGIPFRAVHLVTGWDHPITMDYVRETLPKVIGVPVVEIGLEGGMVELIRRKKLFPNGGRMRFCTSELKVEPMARYIDNLTNYADVVNAVGIRAEESEDRAQWSEWARTEWADSWTWAPILKWTFQDVVDIHARHGVAPNPLYLKGAERVGCWPCIFAKKEEIRLLAQMDPERIDLIEQLEAEMNEGAKQRGTREGRTWFKSKGQGGPTPIRKAVEWSMTSHGGKQFELFSASPRDAGCMRWGLCDTGAKGYDV